jgi:hypothetical protein
VSLPRFLQVLQHLNVVSLHGSRRCVQISCLQLPCSKDAARLVSKLAL